METGPGARGGEGDAGGAIVERVRYTPYGVARHGPREDLTGDGAVNFNDMNVVLGALGAAITEPASAYNPDADLNADGDVDFDDLNALLAKLGTAALPEGALSSQTVDNTVGYAGYILDPATGLYCVRHRWLDPALGRWTSRDPAGYVDGANLYGYVGGSPLRFTDPDGLLPWLPPQTIGGIGRWIHEESKIVYLPPLRDGSIARTVGNMLAVRKCKNMAATAELGVPGALRNAILHCVFQACLTRELGLDRAYDLGEIHEKWGPGARDPKYIWGPIDTWIDRYNNDVGRAIGWQESNKDLRAACRNAMLSGELISDVGIKKFPGVPDSRLPSHLLPRCATSTERTP